MSLNWPQLVAQGRAKDIGLAWNEEEQEALAALIAHTNLDRVSVAPYVRNGILTVEDYDQAKAEEEKAGDKDTKNKTRKELEKAAKALNVEFNEDMTDSVLAGLIKKAEEEAANAPAPLSREELEAKATALGVTFRANTSDETLAKNVAKAEEEAAKGTNGE